MRPRREHEAPVEPGTLRRQTWLLALPWGLSTPRERETPLSQAARMQGERPTVRGAVVLCRMGLHPQSPFNWAPTRFFEDEAYLP